VREEAGPQQPENLTDEPFEAVRVELKTLPAASFAKQHLQNGFLIWPD